MNPQRSWGHLPEELKTARPRHHCQRFLVVLQKFNFLDAFLFAAHLVIMWKREHALTQRGQRWDSEREPREEN